MSAAEFSRFYNGPVNICDRHTILADISQLKGKDLMCWCPLDQPCHADILLALANPRGPD
jgi:hypothetical protein